MISITFITLDGNRHTVEAAPGTSVMQAAIDASIEGILAECGGAGACATCRCAVVQSPRGAFDAASEMERDMLDFIGNDAEDAAEDDRLTCQIKVSEVVSGAVFQVKNNDF